MRKRKLLLKQNILLLVSLAAITTSFLLPHVLFAAEDLTAPVMTAVSVTPSSIDVTAGSEDVTVTVTITDDLSGFDYGYIRFGNPSGGLYKAISVYPTDRTSGDAIAGIYEKTITFPQFSEAGDWILNRAWFYDVTTNKRDYYETDLIAAGLNETINVTSIEDTTAPQLTDFSFTPAYPVPIDVSTGSDVVTLTVELTDDLSGLNYGYIWFYSPGQQYKTTYFNTSHLIAGDALSGTYQTTTTFPQYSETGDWTATIRLTDMATNQRYYSTEDLDLSSIPSTLAVYSNPDDTAAPVPVTFDFLPKVVSTVWSPDSVTFTTNLTDDLTGFNYGYIRVSSPSAEQNHQIYFNGTSTRTSGNALNGIYEIIKEFPRYSEYGDWEIQYLNVRDKVGNYKSHYTQELADLGFPTTIKIEGVIPGGGGVYTIPAEGMFIETDDGGMTMEFPAGAVPDGTEVTVTKVGRHEEVNIYVGTSPEHAPGQVLAEYNFEPDGLEFLEGVTVTMTVDVTDLNQNRRDRLDIYLYDVAEDAFYPVAEEQIISIITTDPDAEERVYMIFTILLEHFSDYAVIEHLEDVSDTIPPTVVINIPTEGQAVQGDTNLATAVTDESNISTVSFTIREMDDTLDGGIIGYEPMPATQNPGTDLWELVFDSTQLLDGYYLIFAEAVDEHGNEGMSEVIHFTVRNWAFVELLPASSEYKAGRTIPIKFSLLVDEAVDLSTPFVHNEQLEIKIYETSNPGSILQTSQFGDSSIDYRINSETELYITNFRTAKNPTEYTVEIKRNDNDLFIGAITLETKKK